MYEKIALMLKKTAFVLGLLASSILALMQIVILLSPVWREWEWIAFFWVSWMIPVLCATAMFRAIRRPSGYRAAFALSVSLLGFYSMLVFAMTVISDLPFPPQH